MANSATVTVRDLGAERFVKVAARFKPSIDVGIVGDSARKRYGERELASSLKSLAKAKNSKQLAKAQAKVVAAHAKVAKAKATLADVAGFHEFGTDTIPARPFIRGYVENFSDDIREFGREGARLVLEGRIDAERFGRLFGVKIVGGIRKYMATNIAPPLKPATIARKGSSVALIDTGLLRSSIIYRLNTSGR